MVGGECQRLQGFDRIARDSSEGTNMDEGEIDRLLGELQDRRDIERCIALYCRAVDRMDRELLLECYHEDAIDDHGAVCGSREEFADWVTEHIASAVSASHIVANHHCDLDGDIAHTETYFIVATVRHEEPRLVFTGGRYIDRFEKRNQRWAIAARKVLKDWWGRPGDSALTGLASTLANRNFPPMRDHLDPSYQRPLII